MTIYVKTFQTNSKLFHSYRITDFQTMNNLTAKHTKVFVCSLLWTVSLSLYLFIQYLYLKHRPIQEQQKHIVFKLNLNVNPFM